MFVNHLGDEYPLEIKISARIPGATWDKGNLGNSVLWKLFETLLKTQVVMNDLLQPHPKY